MRSLTVTIGELSAGPREIEFSFTQEQIEEQLGDLAHPRSFHRIKGTVALEKISGAIDAHGTLEGFFTVSCNRCLKPAKLAPPEHFQLLFLKEPERFDAETELTSDDLETAWYKGDTLDLEPHIWDQILLSIPMVPLCSETCEGIKYNKGQEPKEKKPDPRWSALEGLKID